MAQDVQQQLDSVLSNLYDFGDDLESTTVTVSKSEQGDNSPPDCKTELKESLVHPAQSMDFPNSKRGKRNPSFFFNALKEEVRNQSAGTTVPSTPASKTDIEVVTFVSHKEMKQTKSNAMQNGDSKIKLDSKEEENDQTFDFEKARLEVHKFGITGYKKEKQRKFEQERAIMLGAKPPKREYVNYKVYQERKKEQEQAKKEKSFKETVVEPVRKKQKQGQKVRKSKKAKGSGFVPDGQVGRFRDGALILSNKDIHKIKQSKFSK